MKSAKQKLTKSLGIKLPVSDDSKYKIKIVAKLLFLVVFALLLAGFVWSFTNWQKTKREVETFSKNGNAKTLTQKQESDLIAKLNKHIVTPNDEKPVIAEISNITKLLESEPEFYKNAKNGDIVFIYEKARKAYIYDREKDSLVNMGPVYIGDEAMDKKDDTASAVDAAAGTTEQK